jgi:hypothetical protein
MSLAGDLAGVPCAGRLYRSAAARHRLRGDAASTLASAACGKEIVSTRIVREMARKRGGAAQAT